MSEDEYDFDEMEEGGQPLFLPMLLQNTPRNTQEALKVLRKEALYRKSPKYLNFTKNFVMNN